MCAGDYVKVGQVDTHLQRRIVGHEPHQRVDGIWRRRDARQAERD